MQSWMSAIRSYFEERNRVWVTGDPSPLYAAANAATGAQWRTHVGQGIDVKLRSMHHRRTRVLRAHSRIDVRRLSTASGSDVQDVQVRERIAWVYPDGFDYGVEARVIEHRQRWARIGDVWRLVEARESSESRSAGASSGLQAAPAADADAAARLRRARSCKEYDRVRALRYAELWWDGWNPIFPRLVDDCTNFVSQCLYAGQMPMEESDNRGVGWWYRFQDQGDEPWSYSWSVAQALYAYLVGKVGARVVPNAKDLKIGDVIFYDWDGSGRYHHTTIVTDFDSMGDPLVNAHTDASYHRHYLYLDSRAWSPRTRYQFVHIPDSFC